MEYKLLRNIARDLDKEVQKHLDDGWELHGHTFSTGGTIQVAGELFVNGCPQPQEYPEVAQAVIKKDA